MRILGMEIGRRKDASPVPYGSNGRWLTVFTDLIPGSFQRDESPSIDTALAYDAVFACVTQIAADIGSLRPKLMQLDQFGIWSETTSAAFSPVLRKPNRFQNHIQFKEWWITSKLLRGNAYALKERDSRGVVVRLYLLDPCRVTPLVADDGSVFYDLGEDYLSGLTTSTVRVPASEIIHDRMNCLFHPLVGLSPLFASGSTALQGLRIQRNSTKFFANNSSPGGILTAPGEISEPTAKEMKRYWDANFTGEKAGGVAVLGDGLKYQPLRMSAVESQLIEQLKLTAERVCACFHIPASIVGFGTEPVYANGETPQGRYYNLCLRALIESFELCLDEGLGLGQDSPKDGVVYGTELELDGLLRMDMPALIQSLGMAVEKTIMVPNEARKRLNLGPQKGGDKLWMQQQNYSLPALDERDRNKPFDKPAPAPVAPPVEMPKALDADAVSMLVKAALVESEQRREAVKASEEAAAAETASLLLNLAKRFETEPVCG